MSRRLLAIASVSLLALACARATDAGFDEDDDSGAGAADPASGPSTTGSGSGGASTSTSTSASGPGGAGGSGGGGGATTSGGGGGSTSSSGSGGNTNSCAHDVCVVGVALTPGCGDPCVDTVCTLDDYCCDDLGGEWDSVCVDAAVDLCGSCVSGWSPGDLVITEIMNNPAAVDDAAGEWFEIYNASGASVDLVGLVIRHQSVTVDPSATFTINVSVVVPAGGYAVLGLNGNASTNGGVNVSYVYPSTVNLSNTADHLAIEAGVGNVIDAVSYNETSGLDPNGKSRSLNPSFLSHLQNDNDTNFCEATSVMSGGDAGTPGAANDACP